MGIVKRVLRLKEQAFVLKYEKSLDQWEVITDMGIIYMGSKENCQRYVKHASHD